MAPYLVYTFEDLLQFYQKFVQPEILEGAKTTIKLLKIDMSKQENRVSNSKIDAGFSLKYDFQKLKISSKGIYDREKPIILINGLLP